MGQDGLWRYNTRKKRRGFASVMQYIYTLTRTNRTETTGGVVGSSYTAINENDQRKTEVRVATFQPDVKNNYWSKLPRAKWNDS